MSKTPNGVEMKLQTPWWLWVAVAVGCALIVATVVITMVICGRKKGEKSSIHGKPHDYVHGQADYTDTNVVIQHCTDPCRQSFNPFFEWLGAKLSKWTILGPPIALSEMANPVVGLYVVPL